MFYSIQNDLVALALAGAGDLASDFSTGAAALAVGSLVRVMLALEAPAFSSTEFFTGSVAGLPVGMGYSGIPLGLEMDLDGG